MFELSGDDERNNAAEVRSTEDVIEAIFDAASEPNSFDKEWDRKLSDAIDAALSHAYAEGRADQLREDRHQAMLAATEKAMRALNETGQGEHGLTHEGSTVRAIENIWGLPPRSKHAA